MNPPAIFLALALAASLLTGAPGPAHADGSTIAVPEILVDEGIGVRSVEGGPGGLLPIDRSIDRRREEWEEDDKDSQDRPRVRHRRPSERYHRRNPDRFELDNSGGAAYERVNGFSLWHMLRGRGGEAHVPELDITAGYGFAAKRFYYDVQLMQPIAFERTLNLGARVYRITDTRDFDEEIVGDMENSLAAVLFKEDFRDYHQAEGYEVMAEVRFGEGRTLRGSYVREDVSSMDNEASWSIFHGDEAFRSNRPINDGRMQALRATFTLDKRREHSSPHLGLGVLWRVEGEFAGGEELGGDYYYDRYLADLRHYTKLSPNLGLDLRLAWGHLDAQTGGGTLYPIHKEFYVGGISTLPGYTHKQFTGDRMLLGNMEYRIGRGSKVILLADAGDAWHGGDGAFEVHADVGVGFETDDEGLRVIAARRLDDPDAEPAFWVRLKRTF